MQMHLLDMKQGDPDLITVRLGYEHGYELATE